MINDPLSDRVAVLAALAEEQKSSTPNQAVIAACDAWLRLNPIRSTPGYKEFGHIKGAQRGLWY